MDSDNGVHAGTIMEHLASSNKTTFFSVAGWPECPFTVPTSEEDFTKVEGPRSHANIAPGQAQKLINNAPPYTINEMAKAYNAAGLSVNGAGQKIAAQLITPTNTNSLRSRYRVTIYSV